MSKNLTFVQVEAFVEDCTFIGGAVLNLLSAHRGLVWERVDVRITKTGADTLQKIMPWKIVFRGFTIGGENEETKEKNQQPVEGQ